ncbi:phage tail assembly protein [Desulfolutivibrio sulfodismutans]|uniref:phage tail assembly protein n=1 Tax=Desulfolutivibrio sulfodismutans TaxID=63561 RepID=UPI00159D0FF0|nr:phage tail assembly protein [Desulfolutivibrio sulfodismutans]QLA14180.1 hypothetical protein GD606_18865 [Desulfolutivibrio sulfodismutans DSM 3696]
MAKTKTITLPVPTDAEPQAVREVTLHELRIGTILDLLERARDGGQGTDPLAALSELLTSGQVLTGLSLDDLKRLAPSDLGTLWEAFQEVNAAFLACSGKRGSWTRRRRSSWTGCGGRLGPPLAGLLPPSPGRAFRRPGIHLDRVHPRPSRGRFG